MSAPAEEFYQVAADAFRSVEAADWRSVARANQLPPPGDWRIWLLLAGRGFGKTRTVCEFARGEVEGARAARVAIIGATASDCRDVLVEGPAGLLAVAPRWAKPVYEPTKRRLTWPNGAQATLFSADEPERLRGPQHDLAICDELAAWRYPEAFDMLLLGLRLGKNPRVAIATTPRPTKLIRELLAREGKDVVVTRGSTLENSANLAPAYVEQIIDRYRGTRLERQEIFGELLEDVPGALWTRETLERTRVAEAPTMQRIVVAIDPAGSSEEGADLTGIIVAGLGADGHAYVLDDLSGRYDPTSWARRAIGAYHVWKADRIVCETNYGGEMVENTIAAVDPTVPVKRITSSRGKVLRAEPIAAFFEQRRAHMVGSHPMLEDQACRFTADWQRARDGSPDRVDAMVFALSELMLGISVGGFFREASLLCAGEPLARPIGVDGAFAVIGTAAKLDANRDAVAVVYFLRTARRYHVAHVPLIVADWGLASVEEALVPDFLPRVLAHLEELAGGARLTARSFVAVESSAPVGAQLRRNGREQGVPIEDVSTSKWIPTDLPTRAAAAARVVGAGKVKVARAAYEKLATYRGVTRNHLLGQVLGYRPEGEAPEACELLIAFTLGVVANEGSGLVVRIGPLSRFREL